MKKELVFIVALLVLLPAANADETKFCNLTYYYFSAGDLFLDYEPCLKLFLKDGEWLEGSMGIGYYLEDACKKRIQYRAEDLHGLLGRNHVNITLEMGANFTVKRVPPPELDEPTLALIIKSSNFEYFFSPLHLMIISEKEEACITKEELDSRIFELSNRNFLSADDPLYRYIGSQAGLDFNDGSTIFISIEKILPEIELEHADDYLPLDPAKDPFQNLHYLDNASTKYKWNTLFSCGKNYLNKNVFLSTRKDPVGRGFGGSGWPDAFFLRSYEVARRLSLRSYYLLEESQEEIFEMVRKLSLISDEVQVAESVADLENATETIYELHTQIMPGKTKILDMRRFIHNFRSARAPDFVKKRLEESETGLGLLEKKLDAYEYELEKVEQESFLLESRVNSKRNTLFQKALSETAARTEISQIITEDLSWRVLILTILLVAIGIVQITINFVHLCTAKEAFDKQWKKKKQKRK